MILPPHNPVIPCLPDSAPFTTEQRAYLNGFLAGLFSGTSRPATGPAANPQVEPRPLAPLCILFGSQTGNAEALAKKAAKEAGKSGFAPTLHDMASFDPAHLAGHRNVLVVTSTYGDGDPPDNAKAFWNGLAGDTAPRLNQTRFSVCALGDSSYPKFCEFGKQVDERLAALGATRAHPRQDCDADFDEAFQAWLRSSVPAFLENSEVSPTQPATAPASQARQEPAPTASGWSRKNPFPARLTVNRRLNRPGSAKDTRHFEITLEGSGLAYEVGDALGVVPANPPALADEIVAALGCRGDEPVPGRDTPSIPFREALVRDYEITRIPAALLRALAERTGDETLRKVTAPDANGELTRYLWGREVIDLLLQFPQDPIDPATFVSLLRKLQPRLYSIASSPKAHPGEVHLCVAAVRYESLGRARQGVCSTFLADRVEPLQTPVPVFVQSSHGFRLPESPDRAVIMIGPGTGIAPFRAFLEEREAVGARGGNWLFFGDQRRDQDFLYQEELEAMTQRGVLTRLDLAFSRDQPEKIYVQDRMREQAAELWRWIEEGAHVYVCGDAKRMASDVDAALHELIQSAGAKSPEEAADYVARLKTDKRYQRDVY